MGEAFFLSVRMINQLPNIPRMTYLGWSAWWTRTWTWWVNHSIHFAVGCVEAYWKPTAPNPIFDAQHPSSASKIKMNVERTSSRYYTEFKPASHWGSQKWTDWLTHHVHVRVHRAGQPKTSHNILTARKTPSQNSSKWKLLVRSIQKEMRCIQWCSKNKKFKLKTTTPAIIHSIFSVPIRHLPFTSH